MRVLYVLRYYPTLSETFVVREIAELQRRSVHVEVAALGGRADGALADGLPEVTVHRPPRGVAGLAALAGMAPTAWTSEGRRGLEAARGLRRKDALRTLWLARLCASFDRVHVHFAGEAAVWALAAATTASVPMSVTAHAVDLFVPRPELPDILAAAQPVCTVSRYHLDWIRTHHGVQAALVPCGVDPGRYAPAGVGGDGPLRVVSVARWVPKKGLDTLLEALFLLGTDWRLRLVSEPPEPVEDERVVVGAVPPSAVPQLLAESQVFVLPCRRAPSGDQDGLPVAILEAMASGLPVVTTDVAGIREVVDEDVGWIVPCDDPAALARCLHEVAASPAERARRGAAGRERVVEQGRTVVGQVDALLAAWEAR